MSSASGSSRSAQAPSSTTVSTHDGATRRVERLIAIRTVTWRSQPANRSGSRSWSIRRMTWRKTSCVSSAASLGFPSRRRQIACTVPLELLDQPPERRAVPHLPRRTSTASSDQLVASASASCPQPPLFRNVANTVSPLPHPLGSSARRSSIEQRISARSVRAASARSAQSDAGTTDGRTPLSIRGVARQVRRPTVTAGARVMDLTGESTRFARVKDQPRGADRQLNSTGSNRLQDAGRDPTGVDSRASLRGFRSGRY